MTYSTSPDSFWFKNTENLRHLRYCQTNDMFFCPFYQPHPTSGALAIDRVRRIKRVEENDFEKILIMVRRGFNYFAKYHPLETFDYIIQIPSSADLAPLLYDCAKEISNEFNNAFFDKSNIVFSSKILKKNLYKDLIVDNEMVQRSGTQITMDSVGSWYGNLKKYQGNETIQVKGIKASYRRYATGYFSINPQEYIENLHIANLYASRKILLIDDTIGEGKTFLEAIKTLEGYAPIAKFVCFALVRDFPSLTLGAFGLR